MSALEARAESLLSAEKRTLEMIANGASLPDVLNDLCLTIDAHAQGVISTVLLMDPDGLRLWPGAGPRFPTSLIPAVSPWTIGPDRGACGTAAFLKQRVIISDITSDPRWPDGYRTLAISHGLRAAWSEPLISNDGAVLGTFAMYYGEPRVPASTDLELIQAAGHIALIAIQMEKSQAAMRESEERLRLAQQAACIGTFEWNIRTGVNTWTPELEAMYGLSTESFGGTQTAFETLVHPDDRAEVIELVRASMKTGQPTNGEWRVVWPDGSVHWIAGRWQVFMNESGEPLRMIGVNIDVTERKVAEQALRESEQRFRLAAQTGKMYSFEWDVTTDVVVRSPERVKVLGATEPLRFSHQRFVNSIHVDDRPKFIATIAKLTPENPTAEIIYRASGSDGALVWLKSSGRAFFDPEGKMLRVIGMVADITDLKQAEETLSEMTHKLIGAQEQERSRLARELHDDINQQIALLGTNLGRLRQNSPSSPEELREQIAKVSEQLEEIGENIQALSHRLHSPKLEYLGLAAAAASFCREFSDQQKVEITFHSENVPKELQPGISVCLYRVLQEALQNAAKHSGSRRFQVSLSSEGNDIELTVHDSGIGFEPKQAIEGQGLGLISMQERLKLVDGHLSIDSKPQQGTMIHARVPLNPRAKSAGAVG